jgi:hypothetical protein
MSKLDYKSAPALSAEAKAVAAQNAPTPTPPSKVPISDLRPTQMTVGYAEVLFKRQQWRALNDAAKSAFIAENPLPSVLGLQGRHFIVDHHHLARALLEEHVTRVQVTVLADLSALDKYEFWNVMDFRQWVHPYDAKGRKHPCRALQKKVSQLQNDSYRSLAAAVRMAGGFSKEQTPFEEFLWADFFRRRIPAKLLKTDPDAALTDALQLVHDEAAKHLPGWTAAATHRPGTNRPK